MHHEHPEREEEWEIGNVREWAERVMRPCRPGVVYVAEQDEQGNPMSQWSVRDCRHEERRRHSREPEDRDDPPHPRDRAQFQPEQMTPGEKCRLPRCLGHGVPSG